MTEAQAAWLRKLRDKGPQDASVTFDGRDFDCWCAGYSHIVIGNLGFVDHITPAGLAALAEHEETKG